MKVMHPVCDVEEDAHTLCGGWHLVRFSQRLDPRGECATPDKLHDNENSWIDEEANERDDVCMIDRRKDFHLSREGLDSFLV